MLVGYNHEVAFGGQRLHVQTEDHGAHRAQVVTQVFAGGQVLATRCSSYPSEVSSPAAGADPIRRLMQAQHRAMLRAALRGEFHP